MHEITHLFVPLWYPAWANEGMAMFISNESETKNLDEARAYIKQYGGGRREMFSTLMLRPSYYYTFKEFHSVSYSLTVFLMNKLLMTKFPNKTLNENKLVAAKEFADFMKSFQSDVMKYENWREKEKAINQLFLEKFSIDIGIFITQWERWEANQLNKQ